MFPDTQATRGYVWAWGRTLGFVPKYPQVRVRSSENDDFVLIQGNARL